MSYLSQERSSAATNAVAECADHSGRVKRSQWLSVKATVAECTGHSGRVC
jgi:hypothetical protein